MKIVVDYDACEANGICQRKAPDLFRLEDDDSLTVLINSPDSDQRQQLEAAINGCPRSAIRFED